MIRDTGKADDRGRAVGHPGHPTVVAIAMRENGGDGKCGRGVTGRKTAINTGVRNMTVEKGVVERAGRWDVRRTQSMRRDLQHYVKYGAVGVGFTGEERGLFRVGIVAEIPDD